MSDLRSIEALRGVLREEWALAFMEDPSLADSVLAEVDELAARAERYREALEFYADPETYFAIGFFPDPPCGEFMDDFEDVGPQLGSKPGKRARRALSDSLTET